MLNIFTPSFPRYSKYVSVLDLQQHGKYTLIKDMEKVQRFTVRPIIVVETLLINSNFDSETK